MKQRIWLGVGIAIAAWLVIGGAYFGDDFDYSGDSNSDARH